MATADAQLPGVGSGHSRRRAGASASARSSPPRACCSTSADSRTPRSRSIARAVGINKALIYRHFSSKEELLRADAHQLSRDLAERLDERGAGELDPVARLEEGWLRYTTSACPPRVPGLRLSLMRRPAAELSETVSDVVWIRLGQGMAACLGQLSQILAEGAQQGVFTVEDPDFTANQLYAQTLGTMHLARIGMGVRTGAGGVPEPFPIEPARCKRPASPTCWPRWAQGAPVARCRPEAR